MQLLSVKISIKGSRRTGCHGGFNNCGCLFAADVYKRHHRKIYRGYAHGRHHHIDRILGRSPDHSSLIILPAHLNFALIRSEKKSSKLNSWHERLREGVERILRFVIERVYTSAIKYVVKNRYFAFSIGIGVLIISLGIVAGGYVPFVFFQKGESDWIVAEINYPLGTPASLTEKTIQHLERKAFDLNNEFSEFSEANGDLVKNTFALVGLIPRRDWKPAEIGSHVGEVWVEMVTSGERSGISTNDVQNKWRRLVGELPGIERLAFFALGGGPAGNAIEIQLSGQDFDQLSLAADELKAEIKTYPGTYDGRGPVYRGYHAGACEAGPPGILWRRGFAHSARQRRCQSDGPICG
jgi:multidrug efflux pump subunit AcrB